MVENNLHKIRRAEPSDADGLVALVKNGMPGYPFEAVYDLDAVAKTLVLSSDYRAVSVDEHGQIIGTAVLGNAGEYMQEIKRVVVDPRLRRNGVASELTMHLAKVARTSQVAPWMDARADQPGMQKAGLRAGLSALSLEMGKHCVYFHLNESGIQIGPGRETMVHITSLTPDLSDLAAGLFAWPLDLVEELVANLEGAFSPALKKIEVVGEKIPSAAAVKERIESELINLARSGVKVSGLSNPDLSMVTLGSLATLVVKPDSSGFLLGGLSADLPLMIQLGHSVGLQVITTYVDVTETSLIELLRRSKMKPTMVRLNQKTAEDKVVWQVGWRSTANGFDDCLHTVNLDDEVKAQVKNLIDKI